MTDIAPSPAPAVATLAELHAAVTRAQAADPFARVVVIADHHDAARAVSHWLGAQDTGLVNVTVQTGRRLAAELAGPDIKALPSLLEGPAVRLAAENEPTGSDFQPAGRSRYYRSLAEAFRHMAERPEPDAAADPPEDTASAPSDMNRLAEKLYDKYLDIVKKRGFVVQSELSRAAADKVRRLPAHRLPYVIYYLPRRLSAGDTALQRALLDKGQCEVIRPFAGNGDRDDAGAGGDVISHLPNADRIAIIAAPDPDEEVRTVIRQIAAAKTPFHRTAVLYRQSNPYDSLLRQELDFAKIPYAGAEYRTLGDTPTGRVLLGIVDLAAGVNANSGAVDRERLIEWITTTLVHWPEQASRRPVPARWVSLAREARANGAPQEWRSRLNAHIAQQEARLRERDGELTEEQQRRFQSVKGLADFVTELVESLHTLVDTQSDWTAASDSLEKLLQKYRWYTPAESDDDLRKIDDLVSGLAELAQWSEDYNLAVLQDAVREGLRDRVSERGRPVGAGVYLGPPAGIVGAAYDAVYVLGMVEGQFPPRPAASPWLADNPAERQRDAALERYDFRGAIAAAAKRAVLCWPAATAERRAAYPSRWLVDAANRCHQAASHTERLTYETLTHNAAQKPWLTVIASRAAGLRQLPQSNLQPADADDYRLMHLSTSSDSIAAHPAVKDDVRMVKALAAGNARYHRSSRAITEWDGLVPAAAASIAAIGSQETPISPSALETWATCPYQYFLNRILRLSAPPDDDEDDNISALDKGNLVHKILERFVKEGKRQDDIDGLLELAEAEFQTAEARGVTGRHLLWQVTMAQIREGLRAFLAQETEGLDKSEAEVGFKEGVPIPGLGEVWFNGKIDRLDVLADGSVQVRDFKTGRPNNYTSRLTAQNAVTVANGRALQLPVYAAAVRRIRSLPGGTNVEASYCFPLATPEPILGARPYDEVQEQDQFHTTLNRIVGTARAGVFPATPDGDGDYSNCRSCDFKRLCPSRRRQIWERKGRHDPVVQRYNDLGGKAAIKDGN